MGGLKGVPGEWHVCPYSHTGATHKRTKMDAMGARQRQGFNPDTHHSRAKNNWGRGGGDLGISSPPTDTMSSRGEGRVEVGKPPR